MNGLILDDDNGKDVWICPVCDARTDKKGLGRFERRHPKLCTERRRIAAQLARGVRCVELEKNPSAPD